MNVFVSGHALTSIVVFVCSFLQINYLKTRLSNLREVVIQNSPSDGDLVPPESEIDPKKLSSGANVITDTCNAAQKLRRILVDTIGGCYEYDCMHHLRNIWFGNMEKKLTKKLNAMLRSDLDEIDPRFRVTMSVSALLCAVDKEFSLSSNYLKGHDELFLEWM